MILVKNTPELLGWLGMFLLLSASVPVSVGLIMGWTEVKPPIDMVILTDVGLAFYLVRAIAQKDLLYITSNGIGVAIQSTLLSVILFM